jgi:hypothetical protein
MPSSTTITTTVAARINIDDAEVLRRIATREDRTVSFLLNRLVREAVREQRIPYQRH